MRAFFYLALYAQIMKNYRIIYIGLVAASLALTLVYFATTGKETPPQSRQPDDPAYNPSVTPRKAVGSVDTDRLSVHEQPASLIIVNEKFEDPPDVQKAWGRRGQDIVLKNHPRADDANFRNTFFHRGFNNRAMTCGEVQFLANGKVLENYQRFIYVGVQSTHLESEVPNFELLWEKFCVQTSD